MILRLHQLKPSAGSRHRPKRLGRGNASGHGTYSGRGCKGQKARSGGRNRLKQKGMRFLLLSTPKLRGFKSARIKPAAVNLSALERYFQEGEEITPDALRKKGLIGKMEKEVKILAGGGLTKKLEIKGCALSAAAKILVEKAGGTAET